MDDPTERKKICGLIRLHISIRNRSWMKRVHHSCFIGSDAVDFIVQQGWTDTRKGAVELGQKMYEDKLLRHVSDSYGFRDAYFYYRFAEDEDEVGSKPGKARLAATCAGNGQGTHIGEDGCKFSFSPHTAHNSYVMDIALAQEIERAIAGPNREARHQVINKLRTRVKEEASVEAPDWQLTESTEQDGNLACVYQRKRPRGGFKNVKMTGVVGEKPKDFIKGLMNFDTRGQWESMFVDGVIVEEVDLGEGLSPFFDESDYDDDAPPESPHGDMTERDPLGGHVFKSALSPRSASTVGKGGRTISMAGTAPVDDVSFFLETIEQAGIPSNTPLAFLNDAERQYALAHLRKMMMMSNPQECMLCAKDFNSQGEIRFCPCCAMVSCAACVGKRVFEVASRQMVSVCVHCFKESSRICHPPAHSKSSKFESPWWRKDKEIEAQISKICSSQERITENVAKEDDLEKSVNLSTSLIPGLFDEGDDDNDSRDEIDDGGNSGSDADGGANGDSKLLERRSTFMGDDFDDNGDEKIEEMFDSRFSIDPLMNAVSDTDVKGDDTSEKTIRCKGCGQQIARSVEAIEEHMRFCEVIGSNDGTDPATDVSTELRHSTLGGISRRTSRGGTRIIYRVARSSSTLFKPREVCALQDSFIDTTTGVCYVYEISVRHCEVRGIDDHISAEVLLLLFAAAPNKGNKKGSSITVISQVDSRAKSWLTGNPSIGAPSREDIVRELKAAGSLKNILTVDKDGGEDKSEETKVAEKICLEDFELLSVLGRGGFGKVMQVRSKKTSRIFAMKILKKSELQRRKQVERTQTEMKILAAVKHPFVVQMHYAFQNEHKLFMVMDFVQGGDFFTFLRKFRKLPEDWCRVYTAEIAMALQHLHGLEIVYRDLKPENILLCADGHLKLTDFGLSRFFETRPPAAEDILGEDNIVTRSFCGTEQYMAPEMLLQQGHNFRMDWWSLGLLMHEMVSSRHPFHGPTHYDTLRNMVTKQPKIDSRLTSECKQVIQQLLVNNPKARLCSKRGIEELKEMPFFEKCDWEGLYTKEVPMPFSPKLNSSTDVSSFESMFTDEIPVDSVSEKTKEKKNNTVGGFFSFFGLGGKKGKDKGLDADASFAGFNFTREDVSSPDPHADVTEEEKEAKIVDSLNISSSSGDENM